MIHIKGNTSRFGSAIQILPSDIRKYLSSFLIAAVKDIVNSYVRNKV